MSHIIGNSGIAIGSNSQGGGGMPAPPFSPTSADNGLSVDPITGRIVLGGGAGSPSPLLDNREIELALFSLSFLSGGNELAFFDGATNNISFGLPGVDIFMDNTGGRINLTADIFAVRHNGSQSVAEFEGAIFKASLGDVHGMISGTTLIVDDNIQDISFNTGTITINGSTGFSGTVSPVTSITVLKGIVTAVS